MDRGTPPDWSEYGDNELKRRMVRLVVVSLPPLVTVGAMVGVALVAPLAGFSLLFLASVGAGVLVPALGRRTGLSHESAEEARELGIGVDGSNVGTRVPVGGMIAGFVYGLAGFGFVALVFTAIFLL